jgi:MFS transporter, FSR family, fosmidomycin resistance protein
LLAAWFIIPHGQKSILYFSALAIASMSILGMVAKWFANHLSQASTQKRLPTTSNVDRRTVTLSMTILVALMFSKFVYMSSMHSFYAFYLMDKFGMTAQRAQTDLFILLGAVAVGTFVGGPIGDRIGRKTVIWFSILGTLPFSLALPYANEFWSVALTIPIGLILSSAFPAMLVYAQELLPGRVGMISGLFFGLAFGLGGIGAALMGALADATSINTIFHIASVLPALGLLAFLLPNRERLRGQR